MCKFVHGNFEEVVDCVGFLERSIFHFFGCILLVVCVQVLSAKVPSEEKRREWWQAFYQGAAFPTLARFLLLGNVLALYLHCVVHIS